MPVPAYPWRRNSSALESMMRSLVPTISPPSARWPPSTVRLDRTGAIYQVVRLRCASLTRRWGHERGCMLASMGRGGTPGTLALGEALHGLEVRSSQSGWLRGARVAGLACALACAAALVPSPGRAGEQAMPAAHELGSRPLA